MTKTLAKLCFTVGVVMIAGGYGTMLYSLSANMPLTFFISAAVTYAGSLLTKQGLMAKEWL